LLDPVLPLPPQILGSSLQLPDRRDRGLDAGRANRLEEPFLDKRIDPRGSDALAIDLLPSVGVAAAEVERVRVSSRIAILRPQRPQ